MPATTIPVALRHGPGGAVAEVSTAVKDVAFGLAARVVTHGGAALLIDYGYAAPAHGETLQAVRSHEYAGLLEAPGECAVTRIDELTMVRWRGGSAEQGWQALRAAWSILRPALVGREAVAPRIWAT